MKVTLEPTTDKGANAAKIWSWNIVGNKTAKGSEVGAGWKDGQSHWSRVNKGVEGGRTKG